MRGQDTKISTRKVLKTHKNHQQNTAKFCKNTNSEYTIKYYAKHKIKGTN